MVPTDADPSGPGASRTDCFSSVRLSALVEGPILEIHMYDPRVLTRYKHNRLLGPCYTRRYVI